jgi:hypothetical protein
MSENFEAVVLASFSQFYLRSDDATPEPSEYGDAPLAFITQPGQVMFTSPLQDAALQVRVGVHSDRIPLPEAAASDVIELSVRAGANSMITGWDPSPSARDLKLPLTEGEAYRLRYSITDYDGTNELPRYPAEVTNPIPGLVSIDIWPENLKRAEVVVQSSKAGRYWVVSRGLDQIRSRIQSSRLSTEQERVNQFADEAFSSFPDLVGEAIADEGNGLASKALTFANKPTERIPRSEVGEWRESTQTRIAQMILARAQAADVVDEQ